MTGDSEVRPVIITLKRDCEEIVGLGDSKSGMLMHAGKQPPTQKYVKS